MPVTPEKRQLEDHVHGAVAAQFWSQGIHNSRCLTGQACTAPCEPQPLQLHAPSGLSHTQFLVAARAVRVPVFPGFCGEHGGTVLDRVLLQHGGQKWWGALIGRAKVQRAVRQRQDKTLRQNLADPDNYALAATGRLQLSRATTLKFTAQVDSLQQLQPLMPQGGGRIWQQQQQQQQQRGGWGGKLGQNSSLSVQLKQQLEGLGLQLNADLALNELAVEGVRRYCSTPLRLAVDLTPSSSSSSSSSSGGGSTNGGTGGRGSKLLKSKGLLFRVGLHGAVAPVQDGVAAAAAPAGAAGEQQQQHALSVHCQGSVALSGSHTVWQAPQKPWEAAAAAATTKQPQRRQQQQQEEAVSLQQQQQQQLDLTAEPLDVSSGIADSSSGAGIAAAAVAAGAAADATAAPPSSEQQHGSSSSRPASFNPSSSSSSSSSSRLATKRSTGSSRTTNSSSAKTAASSNPSSARFQNPKPHSSSKKRYLTVRGEEIPLPLCSPAAVQEGLQDSSSRIERLRTELRAWTGRVESGELQQLGPKAKPQWLLGYKEPGSCWSSFLAGPHFKVTGLLGLLGRVPLQQRLLLPASSSSSNPPHHPNNSSSSTSLASSAADSGTAGGTGGTTAAAVPSSGTIKPLSNKARSFFAASATHLDRLVIGSARKLGSSITQESQLRLFGSGGASLQLGEMRRNFFDYSRLEAVLDLGLNAPETSAGSSGSSSSKRGAASSSSRHRTGSSRQQGGRGGRAGRGLGSILGPAAVVEMAAAADGIGSSGGTSQQQQQQQQQVGKEPSPTTAAAAAAAAPGPLGSSSSAPSSKHPAFALEDSGVWNALTLSATQQLVGPVRIRGDWRFALDSRHACPTGTSLLRPGAPLQLLRHVAGISPALVDSAYGVDVIVPGAGGLVRLVGWFSPGRREGGLQVRLM